MHIPANDPAGICIYKYKELSKITPIHYRLEWRADGFGRRKIK